MIRRRRCSCVPTGPFSVNDRGDVWQFFNQDYKASNGIQESRRFPPDGAAWMIGCSLDAFRPSRANRHQLRGDHGVVAGKAVASGKYRIGDCGDARLRTGDRASVRRRSRLGLSVDSGAQY